jgi:hypothetical protein
MWLSILIVFLFTIGNIMLLNLFLAVLLRAVDTEVEEVINDKLDQ